MRRLRSDSDLQLVLLITLAGAALRFATLDVQSFDHDEAVTAGHVLHRSLSETLNTVPDSERTPPLYYVLAWGWTRIFGIGEVGLRTLSTLFGTAMIPVAALVARRFGLGRVAVIAAALVAFNPFLVYYSQEGRAYALLGLLALLSAGAFIRSWREPTPRNLAVWALTAILAISTHYFAAFLVAPRRYCCSSVIPALGCSWPPGPLRSSRFRSRSWPCTSSASTARRSRVRRSRSGPRDGRRSNSRSASDCAVRGIYGLTPLLALAFLAGLAILGWRRMDVPALGSRLAVALAAGAGIPPVILAIAGTPILAARNLTPALVILLLALAVELAALAALAPPSVAYLHCADRRARIRLEPRGDDRGQRPSAPDWRGTAERLGPPPSGGRLLVVPSDASEPLLYYLPNTEAVAAAPPGADAALLVAGVDDVQPIPATRVSSAQESLGGDAEILFERPND